MADKPKELKQGDPCPNCGGELAPVAGAADKDGQTLYRCRTCGYNARFKAAAEPAAAAEGEGTDRAARTAAGTDRTRDASRQAK